MMMRWLALIGVFGFAHYAWANPNDFDAVPVLVDDFTQGINSDIWSAASNPGRNNEKEYYTPHALHTDGQGLHIVAERHQENDSALGKSNITYTSGEIDSRRKFLYADVLKFVAKLPKGDGFWPALWLLAPPWVGEIDVIEGFGDYPDTLQSTLHVFKGAKHSSTHWSKIGLACPENPNCKNSMDALGGKTPDFTADYHQFGPGMAARPCDMVFRRRPLLYRDGRCAQQAGMEVIINSGDKRRRLRQSGHRGDAIPRLL